MRILYFCESYRPHIGGVETVSEALLLELIARGHDVCLITNQRVPSDTPEEVLSGVPIRRLPLSWALGARRLDIVAGLVREVAGVKAAFAPDVAHIAHSGPMDFFHWRSAPQVPTLVTLHIPMTPGPLADALCARAASVVSISHATGDFPIISNGYPEPIAPLADPPDQPVVLALGRLVFDKGFDLLLDAWPLVQGCVPDARLVIAGDGPERARLAGAGAELVGWIPPEAVYRAVDAASVVAIPSRWAEPFGLVALDAAWRARPVVAARRGGLIEIVDDGRTGLLVDPESREELATALVTLLTDRDRARAMGQAARARARERFSLDRMVSEYERAYEALT